MRVERKEKPWGYELLLVRTERYAGKILFIHAGHRLSLQHHATKDEALFLLAGEAVIELESAVHRLHHQRMAADRSYRVKPGRKHRLAALTEATVLEVSTPELEDVLRWQDDYGRAPYAPYHGGRGSPGATGYEGE